METRGIGTHATLTGMLRSGRSRAVIAGAACGGMAALALADFMGSPSLAEYLGSTGATAVSRSGPGCAPGGADMSNLTIFVQEDTSTSPSRLMGTINYSSNMGDATDRIERFVFLVRDPEDPNGPWTTVLDVTAPHGSIFNGPVGSTFSSSFATPDLANGYEYRIRIWDDATQSACRIEQGSGFYTPSP